MPDRWKTEIKKLRRTFDADLERVWGTWDSLEMEGTPFGDLDTLVESGAEDAELREIYYDVGWLRGVSEATGWPLWRPGAKEWRPRD